MPEAKSSLSCPTKSPLSVLTLTVLTLSEIPVLDEKGSALSFNSEGDLGLNLQDYFSESCKILNACASMTDF